MTLVDLLSVISEYSTVEVKDEDGNELGRYDGRDSIPSNLNEREVLEVNACIDLFKDIPYIVITVA